MGTVLDWFGFEVLRRAVMNALQWLPAPCFVLLNIVFVVFGIVLIGRLLKFIWDALPIA